LWVVIRRHERNHRSDFECSCARSSKGSAAIDRRLCDYRVLLGWTLRKLNYIFSARDRALCLDRKRLKAGILAHATWVLRCCAKRQLIAGVLSDSIQYGKRRREDFPRRRCTCAMQLTWLSQVSKDRRQHPALHSGSEPHSRTLKLRLPSWKKSSMRALHPRNTGS
jgi:hypothetical protein